MGHTPTPWKAFNTPVTNPKFLRKIGPLLISGTASDEDILFALKAVNSHDKLVEALKAVRAECMGYVPQCADLIDAALEGM